MKNIYSLVILFISLQTIAQENRDYLSFQDQSTKAYRLYEAKNYVAAYKLVDQLIEKNMHFAYESSEQIDLKLIHALSANYAGRRDGISLIENYLLEHPSHPTTNEAHLELAKNYLKKKEYNIALDHLNQINRYYLDEQQLEEYNLSLGAIFYENKNYTQAEQYFSQVANSDSPMRNEAIYYAALSQYEIKDFEKSWQNFTKIEAFPKYKSESELYKLSMLFEEKNYERLIEHVKKNQLTTSDSPQINQLIGQSYYNLEQYEQSLPFQKAAITTQFNQEAQYQLAYTYYKLENYSAAINAFEKLNIIENKVGQYALFALGDSYLKMKQKQEAKTAFSRASNLTFNKEIQEQSAFHSAKLSYQLNRNNEAINLISAFTKEYPNSKYAKEANEILVDLFLTSNNYKDAYILLNQMNSRSSKMDEALQKVAYFRAVELYNNREFSSAKPLFDQVISLPKNQQYVALSNYWLSEMAYHYNRNELSITYANSFLNAQANKSEKLTSQANYTIGYAEYRQKNYSRAISSLKKVNSSLAIKNDANIRIADSYFALKDYQNAFTYYKKANQPNDYATFQIAILNGLQGNKQPKKQALEGIYTNRPTSAFADDALLETAKMLIAENQSDRAISLLKKLIINYPKSNLLSRSHNQLGFVYYNQADYNQALIHYKTTVKNHPNSEDTRTALTAIRQIYIEKGNPADYFSYLSENKISIDNSEEEQVVYQSAEAKLQNGECEQAIQAFTNYINQYKNGNFLANAYFYRADCQTDQSNAIEDYKNILSLPNSRFTESALIRVARYELDSKNANEALLYFQRLEALSSEAESLYQYEIDAGLMQAYYLKKDIPNAVIYAKKVIEQDNLSVLLDHQARFIIASSLFEKENYSKAEEQFSILAASTRNEYGAEARYYLAKILYLSAEYKKSIEACYRVADQTPSEDDVVAKSFLLISDNYVALNRLFQAKATLKSVIENYSGSDEAILLIANKKLEEINSLEKPSE